MPLPPSHRAYGGAGPFEMGMTWALTVIATMAVCARTYVSVRMLERPGWELFWAWVAYVRPLLESHSIRLRWCRDVRDRLSPRWPW